MLRALRFRCPAGRDAPSLAAGASADKGLGFRVQQPLVNSTVNFKSSTILGYDARVLSLIHYSHELTHLPVKHHVPGSHDEAFGCGCGAYGPSKPSSKNPPSPHANSKLLSADLIYIYNACMGIFIYAYIYRERESESDSMVPH